MNTTTGTAVGTAGAGAMLATVIVWILSLCGIQVPDNVALAGAGLITMGAHYLIGWHVQKSAPGAGGTPSSAP